MELQHKQIGQTLYQSHRGLKTTWLLHGTWFLNKYKINWSRSNHDAKLVLRPALGDPIVLSEYAEGKHQESNSVIDEFFAPVLLGDHSRVELICACGSARVNIELHVDCENHQEN